MYDPSRTACFSGHRPSKLPWGYDESDERCLALKKLMYDVIEALNDTGVTHFICGMAQGCDIYFAEAVLALRDTRPGVTLEAAVPCPGQAEHWPLEEALRYERILGRCDKRTLISHSYTRSCMMQRNRYMVLHSGTLIAAYDGSPGGTMNTIIFAKRQGLTVLELPVA